MSQTLPQNLGGGIVGLQKPIAHDLKQVEKILLSELRGDAPWLNELLQSSTLAQGKRMRPTLLLLAGHQTGKLDERHHSMAAAIEMIHVATLIHDDVLDGADSRRHEPTVNKLHGQRVSILLGDYLFTHAFSVGSRVGDAEAVSILATASNRVCEGEMKQNMWQGNLELPQDEYMNIVADKTGQLCAAACHLGAFISGSNEHVCAGFEKFGRDLGVAFQIIDDVLDIVGDQNSVGKTLGTDAANLKLTLPLIHCRDRLHADQRAAFLKELVSKEFSKDDLIGWLQKTDSIRFARDEARNRITQSLEFAKSLGDGESAKALMQTAEFVLQRTY